MVAKKKLLISFDLSILLYRAYHSKLDGKLKNRIIYRTINWILYCLDEFKPSHVAICLDESDRNKIYRKTLFEGYKANRSDKPQEILDAEKLIMEFCDSVGLKYIKVDGQECDDVISSIQRLCRENGLYHLCITGDGDLTSMYTDKNFRIGKIKKDSVTVLRTWKDVKDNFSKIVVDKPEQVRECLCIQNDVSDGIYGLPRFGKVKSAKLINKYGDLKNIYQNLGDFTDKTRLLLEEYKETLFLNRKLIKLYDKLDVGSIEDYVYNYDYDKACEFLEKHSLEEKLWTKTAKIVDMDF